MGIRSVTDGHRKLENNCLGSMKLDFPIPRADSLARRVSSCLLRCQVLIQRFELPSCS
jgi:hypothetical protein